MNKLIFKVEVEGPMGNLKLFKTFVNEDTGMLSHYLVNQSGTNFSVGNMQCKGWKPDHLDELRDEVSGQVDLIRLVEYIDSGLYTRVPGTLKMFMNYNGEVV
jgi:hypothetical protein